MDDKKKDKELQALVKLTIKGDVNKALELFKKHGGQVISVRCGNCYALIEDPAKTKVCPKCGDVL